MQIKGLQEHGSEIHQQVHALLQKQRLIHGSDRLTDSKRSFKYCSYKNSDSHSETAFELLLKLTHQHKTKRKDIRKSSPPHLCFVIESTAKLIINKVTELTLLRARE